MDYIEPTPSSSNDPLPNGYRWYRELNRGHWFVLIVAALGWLFDTMDQQLFNIARVPAMRDLAYTDDPVALKAFSNHYGGIATAVFMIGWASGGLIFGKLGDIYGRAKVMAWTILAYSLCTGLSAFSVTIWDFMAYRFLTGLGVGGEFAVGVALVAEVMPPRARPFALGFLQSLSAFGNILAAILGIFLGRLEETGAIGDAWRWMFVVGAFPALLVLVIRRRLKEPDSWQKARQEERSSGLTPAMQAGSYRALFSTPTLRRNSIVGILMAFGGIVGLWGIGFFVFDLYDSVLRKSLSGQGLDATTIDGRVMMWKGIVSMMFNAGAFFGISAFAGMSQRLGRKPAFAICFVAAAASTILTFSQLDTFAEVFWMVPLMGFCQLSLFGGYAVYFPELFPTRLRSTGISFCYNVGRFVAAGGPFALGLLTSQVYSDFPEPMRPAGITMCAVFLIGLLAVPFAPETKDKPLPE